MTYTLLAIFLASGNVYVERTGLSLQSCAGRAAIARQESQAVVPLVGGVEYRCEAERSLARKATEQRAVADD